MSSSSGFTKDVDYDEPMKWRLRLRDFNEDVTYATIRSTNTNPALYIQNMRANLNTTMSEVTFDVDNSAGDVDLNWLKAGNTITLQAAKQESYFDNPNSYIFIGNIDYPSRDSHGYQGDTIHVKAISIKQIVYDTQCHIVKSAPIVNIDDEEPVPANSTKFQVYKIIEDMINQKKWTILGDASLKERGHFTSTISPAINTFWPKVSFVGISFGVAFDTLADTIGFYWDIDPTSGNRDIYAKFPSESAVPIQIKTGDNKSITNDDKYRTSYIVEEYRLESTSGLQGNVASRLNALTRIASKSVAGQGSNVTSTSTTNKAIAMPFHAEETDFTTIALILSKIGDPQSPNDRLNCWIVLKRDGKPGPKVLEFAIDLSSIDASPTNIFVDLTDIKRKITNVSGEEDFYIVVFQRSGLKGSANLDEANTIRWHSNAATDAGSFVAEGGEHENYNNFVWKESGRGFCFNIWSSINRLYSITNYSLAEQIGLREPEIIDFRFIEDVNLAIKYLSSISAYSSYFKAPISLKVSLPNDFLFKPYQTIPAVSTKIFPNAMDLELQEVNYDFHENSNQCCSLMGVGLVNAGFPTQWPCQLAV